VTVSLEDHLSEMAGERRTVTVYAPRKPADLADRFGEWNVDFQFSALPVETEDAFAVVRRGEEFLGSVELASVTALTDPRVGLVGNGSSESELDALLELLDDTLFRSVDRRRLLAASREFEDRAWRVGAGRLHAGFQRPGIFDAQRSVYERLAGRGLEVHVYIDGEWDADPIEGVTVHDEAGGELGQYWFVVYDAPASRTESQSCALLAHEREPGAYDGCWTYDADRVDGLATYLLETYH